MSESDLTGKDIKVIALTLLVVTVLGSLYVCALDYFFTPRPVEVQQLDVTPVVEVPPEPDTGPTEAEIKHRKIVDNPDLFDSLSHEEQRDFLEKELHEISLNFAGAHKPGHKQYREFLRGEISFWRGKAKSFSWAELSRMLSLTKREKELAFQYPLP